MVIIAGHVTVEPQQREGVVGGGKQVEHPVVGELRVGVGVKEDDSFPLFFAPLGIVEPQARAEVGDSELRAVRMSHHSPLSCTALPDESYAACMMPLGGSRRPWRRSIYPSA